MGSGIPDANTRAIILLGWARLLGLDDDAFERARGRRIHHTPVHTDDGDQRKAAKEVFERHNAENISTGSEASP